MPTPTDSRTKPALPARYDLLGVPISALDLTSAVDWIRRLAVRRDAGATYVCVRDVNGVVACQGDAELRRIHADAALVTPDGMPVVWWGRLRGHAVQRVYGPDLMSEVCRASQDWPDASHYLCGGGKGVARLLAEALTRRFPGVRITGTSTPPFRALCPEEYGALAADIRESGAKIVWIGLSSPKQERFMAELAPHLNEGVLIGVGAAFDFLSGLKPQAPRWMQRSGIEWLFRFATEPRRLWRRYLVGNSYFLWLIMKNLCHEPASNRLQSIARHQPRQKS